MSNAVVQQLARPARETTTLTDLNTVELRIGQAQQLYPELWRHLDEARALLAERGRDVSRFDVVRAAEGQVLIGAVAERREHRVVQDALIDELLKQEDVTLEDVVVGEVLRGLTIDIQAARFNIEGFHRAAAATHALDGRVRAARELRARCKLPQPGRRAGSDASQ